MKQKYPVVIAVLLAAALTAPLSLADGHGKVPEMQKAPGKHCKHKDAKHGEHHKGEQHGKYCKHKDGKHGKHCKHHDGKHSQHGKHNE